MKKNTKATVYASIAVLSWSTVATAFKIALKTLTYFELLVIASCTALFIFALVLVIQKKVSLIRSFKPSQWVRFAAFGLLNPVAYYLIMFKAYSLLPAQIAQPINYSWPILLLILMAVFTNRPIPALKYVGLVVSLAGVGFISLGASSQLSAADFSLFGIMIDLLSALLWAIYWMLNSKAQETDSMVALFMNFLFGTIYLLAAIPFMGFHLDSLQSLFSGMYVGAFEIGIPFMCFGIAVRTTDNPALINQLCYLAPFLSLIFISVILKEQIYFSTYVGLVLIVGGIIFNQYWGDKKFKSRYS